MTNEEIRTLVETRRDSMGRPRFSKVERDEIKNFLREQRTKGLSAPELAKRTGLSKATVNKMAPLGKRKTKQTFVRLKEKKKSHLVVEGAHGLRVCCADVSEAASILAAASKMV